MPWVNRLLVRKTLTPQQTSARRRPAIEIARQPALAPYVSEELRPTLSVESDAQIEGFIRQFADANLHPVGTCRMGSDADAVVTPRLQVKGVEGLRIVDASIMPTIIAGNTNAPTIMIAEKASDMILADASDLSCSSGFSVLTGVWELVRHIPLLI
ncbi:GMC oxidoreductase [Variovorax sp. YR216]|uniref:GMC oxidoreductase n=1 Tax=Variovorax sp. YR216 TaxID=1882828 RepID=UPI0035241CAB